MAHSFLDQMVEEKLNGNFIVEGSIVHSESVYILPCKWESQVSYRSDESRKIESRFSIKTRIK